MINDKPVNRPEINTEKSSMAQQRKMKAKNDKIYVFQKIPSEIIVFNDGSSSLVGKRLILNIMLKKFFSRKCNYNSF